MAEAAHAIDATPGQRRALGAVPGGTLETPAALRQARGRRVARDLVELSRLQRGFERAELTTLDLAALLRTICSDYPQLALSGPSRQLLATDSRRLARVLFALLDNAYLHGQPPVSVTYDVSEIRIADEGGGFAAHVLERASEPFVTGERARGRGIGLGLAIASRQAALLGAELVLSNAPGGGAVAQLRLGAPPPALAAA